MKYTTEILYMTEYSDFPFMEMEVFDTKEEAVAHFKIAIKEKEAYYGTVKKITKSSEKVITSSLDLSKRRYYNERQPF